MEPRIKFPVVVWYAPLNSEFGLLLAPLLLRKNFEDVESSPSHHVAEFWHNQKRLKVFVCSLFLRLLIV